MDRGTVDVYEGGAEIYRDRPRTGELPSQVARVVERAPAGLRLDLGSGPGVWTHALGEPVVALDAAHAMLRLVEGTPLRIQADLEALPLRRGVVAATLASKSLQHVPHERLPLALADLHRSMADGAPLELVVFRGPGATWLSDDDLPGRMFWQWEPDRLEAVVRGAGFDDVTVTAVPRPHVDELHVSATRARMLPDLVRPGLRVLVCGYNPSEYAADRGVPFARPGNRFWPAALAAGLVSRDRDPWHAVRHEGVGFTDLVKRATVAAADLTTDELRAGLDRVDSLCQWLRPDAVCVLGIGGWRAVVERTATVGWQARTLGRSPVYVMPNPSGLNASTQHAGFVEHLRLVQRGEHATQEIGEGVR